MRRWLEPPALGGILVIALLVSPIASFSNPAAVGSGTLQPIGTVLSNPSGSVSTSLSPGLAELMAPAFLPPSGVVTLGPPPAGLDMTVAVGLSPSQPSALTGLLSALYAPSAPEYRHFLTDAELAANFGPTSSTIAEAAAYFAQFGLSVVPSSDRLMLSVTGPSAAVAAAFGTRFEEYQAPGGRLFMSHPSPATLPDGIPWNGAYGLGNTTPLVPTVAGSSVSDLGKLPNAGCSGSTSELAPCQVWQAYNMTTLISGGMNGSGERLAVVDAYSSGEDQSRLTDDLATFAAQDGIEVGAVNYVYPVPGPSNLNSSTNPAWALEDGLDLEWARASAPGATVDMTFSPNAGVGLYQAVDWIVAHQAANIVSMSWGEPDVGIYNAFSAPCSFGCNASSDGSYALLSPVLAFAAAEGISVFAASGDCGASDGTSGLATNFPASDPDVTGVGGTELTVDASGDYLSEVAWSGNSSGAAAPGCENQGGSGGGYSPFPRPVWQTGLPAGTVGRGVPDISLDAATPVAVVESGNTIGVLGTSVATPVWAGIAAIADQYAGRSLGLLNPSLYSIASGPNYTRDFHDILSGSNGYNAGPGWDPVTGLGTPRAATLVVDLAHPVAVSPSDLAAFVYASPRYGRAPLTVDFHVNATGGTGHYPLEGVSFGNGNASIATNGSVTYTFEQPGVYPVEAYVADSAANYSASPLLAIVVGGGTALSVNLTASTERAAVGDPVLFSVRVTGGIAPYAFNYSFGDGTSLWGSSLNTSSHIYGAPGSFCATVVVSDSADPIDGASSSRVALAAGDAPLPDCRNDTAPLTFLPVPGPGVRDAPADYPQLFTSAGGSSEAGTLPPSIQYTSNDPYLSACECTIFRASGTYEVHGYVNDSENDQAEAVTNVTVAPPLVANFTASALFGTVPLNVEFRASATGGDGANATETNWTFGDGMGAVGDQVAATYDQPGEYLATAHLMDRGDGNASEAFLIDVEPSTPPTPGTLVATVTPAIDVSVGATVNFTSRLIAANGSNLPGPMHWSIGPSSGAFRPSFNWTYTPSSLLPNGTLAVTLKGTDLPAGTSPAATFFLPSFGAVEVGGFRPAVNGLSFSDHGGPLVGPAPLVWTGASILSGPGSLSIVWYLGNGLRVQGLSVRATLPVGLQTVVAVATDSWGDTATDDFPVAVTSPWLVSVLLSQNSGSAALSVTFRANVSGGVGPPYLDRWTFGDGTSGTGGNVTHTYATAGSYPVSLSVTDFIGESAWLNLTVSVRRASELPSEVVLLAGTAVGVLAAIVAASYARRPARPRTTTLSPRREGPDAPRAG